MISKNVRALGQRQRGVALFIALVVLLVITVMGVDGLQTARMEMQMATNARDRDLAFQAAEVALLEGEAAVDGFIPGDLDTFANNTNGRYLPPGAGTQPRWKSVNWETDGTIPNAVADLTGTTAAPPQFIVEHVADVRPDEEDLILTNYGGEGVETTSVFRVTALARGMSGNARVMLQSTYGRQVE